MDFFAYAGDQIITDMTQKSNRYMEIFFFGPFNWQWLPGGRCFDKPFSGFFGNIYADEYLSFHKVCSHCNMFVNILQNKVPDLLSQNKQKFSMPAIGGAQYRRAPFNFV